MICAAGVLARPRTCAVPSALTRFSKKARRCIVPEAKKSQSLACAIGRPPSSAARASAHVPNAVSGGARAGLCSRRADGRALAGNWMAHRRDDLCGLRRVVHVFALSSVVAALHPADDRQLDVMMQKTRPFIAFVCAQPFELLLVSAEEKALRAIDADSTPPCATGNEMAAPRALCARPRRTAALVGPRLEEPSRRRLHPRRDGWPCSARATARHTKFARLAYSLDRRPPLAVASGLVERWRLVRWR